MKREGQKENINTFLSFITLPLHSALDQPLALEYQVVIFLHRNGMRNIQIIRPSISFGRVCQSSLLRTGSG